MDLVPNVFGSLWIWGALVVLGVMEVLVSVLRFARGSMEVCLGSVGVRWKAYRSFSGVGKVS